MSVSFISVFAGVYIALLCIYISEPKRFPRQWMPQEPGGRVLFFFKIVGRMALLLSVVPFAFYYGWEIGIPIWLTSVCLSGLMIVLLTPLRSRLILISVPIVLFCGVLGLMV